MELRDAVLKTIRAALPALTSVLDVDLEPERERGDQENPAAKAKQRPQQTCGDCEYADFSDKDQGIHRLLLL